MLSHFYNVFIFYLFIFVMFVDFSELFEYIIEMLAGY